MSGHTRTAEVVRTATETGSPWVYTKLNCGHSLRGEHASPVECEQCAEEEAQVAAIVAFAKTPEFSHLVLRDLTAAKTGEWMAYLAYRVDRDSPTQCKLALSCKANQYTSAALSAAGLLAHRGPTRGAIAEGWRQ